MAAEYNISDWRPEAPDANEQPKPDPIQTFVSTLRREAIANGNCAFYDGPCSNPNVCLKGNCIANETPLYDQYLP